MLETLPSEAKPLAVLEDFLRALGDPDGGAALYDLHAPDAPLRDAAALLTQARVDRQRFISSHREVSLEGGDTLPLFANPVLLATHSEPGPGLSVAWFELTEMRLDRRVIAALGLRTVSGSARIGWCMLAPRVSQWSYRDGLLQCLADHPWLLGNAPCRPRTSLDAAYFRVYCRPAVKFLVLPETRFSCHMSSACCKHDYEIILPAAAQQFIDAMPWESIQPGLAGTRLPVRPDGRLQLKYSSEACRFLGAQRQCLIHRTLGRQPFAPCAVFPYTFAQTPDGVAVSVSSICGSVRNGLGGSPLERQDDLSDRMSQAPVRQPDGFRLAPGLEVPWETFRDAEKALRDFLDAEPLTMHQRLYIGNRLLGALRDRQPLTPELWLSEPPLATTADLREALRGLLAKILRSDRAALKLLPGIIPTELCARPLRDTPIVARLLKDLLFSKAYSYPFDLTTAHNMAILVYLLTLIMQAAFEDPLPDVMWQELGSLGVHGLLKGLLEEGTPLEYRKLFGSSEFGSWALTC